MAGIGFFAPLPLAMMLPFMAGQSMLMGDAFGKSYQYGKRKISAMSNDEFNRLTAKDLAQDIQADFTSIIPNLSVSMKQSRQFQSDIIREMGEIIKDIPEELRFFLTGSETGGVDANSTIIKILKAYGNLLGPAGTLIFQDAMATSGPAGTTPTPPETTIDRPFNENTIRYSHEQVRKMSDATIQALKQKIVNNTHNMDSVSVRRVEAEWTRRFNPPKEGPPGEPFPTLKNFQFSISKYPMVPKTTIKALNVNLQNGLTKKVVLALANLRASALRQVKIARDARTRAIFQGFADGYTKMILELNRLIGA